MVAVPSPFSGMSQECGFHCLSEKPKDIPGRSGGSKMSAAVFCIISHFTEMDLSSAWSSNFHTVSKVTQSKSTATIWVIWSIQEEKHGRSFLMSYFHKVIDSIVNVSFKLNV